MTTAELIERGQRDLGDNPNLVPSQQYYQPQELLALLNQAQRLFVLLTLCLEKTVDMQLSGVSFYHALQFFPDWIVPLRVRAPGGVKIAPKSLGNLAALDSAWTTRTGSPTHYCFQGFDLLGFYKRDSSVVRMTYAYSPVDMTTSSTPEIPAEYHPVLLQMVPPLARIKEGASEWRKVLPLWSTAHEGIDQCSKEVRSRNRERGYDRMPVELRKIDLSKFARKVK